ncbi:MAG TPA: hypothetical protein VLJ21_05060 [Candidatus Binatia bacterium]|nr:hypothetical protein [Candidatus Binatia bacterium]
MLTNPLDMKECPDCASPNIGRHDARDQVICRDCGLIFEPLEPELEKQFEKTHAMTLGTKSTPKAKRKK